MIHSTGPWRGYLHASPEYLLKCREGIDYYLQRKKKLIETCKSYKETIRGRIEIVWRRNVLIVIPLRLPVSERVWNWTSTSFIYFYFNYFGIWNSCFYYLYTFYAMGLGCIYNTPRRCVSACNIIKTIQKKKVNYFWKGCLMTILRTS